MNSNEHVDLTSLSKVDELSVRKAILEEMVKENKNQLKDKAMIMLAGAFDKDIELKAKGTIVFLERWIKDIDVEIDRICEAKSN